MTLTRIASIALLQSACCVALAACSDGSKDPHAEVVLWPIPSTGASAAALPATSQGRDAALPTNPWGLIDAGGGVRSDAATNSDEDEDGGAPDPSRSVFDPEEVYLFGTLQEGACYRDAVALVTRPNDAVVGFSCDANTASAWIRPTDGRMLYIDDQSDSPPVAVFACDGCTRVKAGDAYPSEPQANDRRVAPVCAAGAFGGHFLPAPDGRVYTQCADGWYGEDGNVVPGSASVSIVQFGHARTALRMDGILDLTTGEVTPLVGLPSIAAQASRARDDGYWVVLAGAGSAVAPELWHVAFDGTATKKGTYPEPPANQQLSYAMRLDGGGRVLQFSSDTTAFRDTVVRRSIDGESKVIYDEASNPLVKIHISGLFTGP